MANDVNELYIKVGLDTKQFDTSLKGLRKEMIALKGVMGSSILSDEENRILKQRFGVVTDSFKELQQEAQSTNVALDESFGNMAKFAGVASSAVGGVIASMSLLGIESKKAGELEKSILQFMAIGNALQAVADNKRLITLAQIYGQKLKDFFLTKEMKTLETSGGGGGTTGGEPTDTSNVAKVNTAANVAQAASITQVTEAVNANTVTTVGNMEAQILQNVVFQQEQRILDNLLVQWSLLTGEEEFNLSFKTGQIAVDEKLLLLNEQIMAQKARMVGVLKTQGLMTGAENLVLSQNNKITGINTFMTTENAMAINLSNGAKAKAAFANGSYITGIKLATLATWDFTKALLANPLVWFALAIAAVVAAVYGLVKAWNYFLDREGAIKEINETIKTTIELNKEWAKENKKLATEIADLDDKLLVQTGKITENQAKKNALYRTYWNELTTEQDKKLKEMADIQKKWLDGEIKTEYLYLTLRKSIQDNFDLNNAKRWEKLQKELQIIENDGNASLLEKQKEASQKRIDLEKQTHDKLIAIWKETWDQYNRLILNIYSTDTQEKALSDEQDIRKRQLELNQKYFNDLKTIQSENKFGDVTFADYQKALDLQRKFNSDSKQLLTDDSDFKIQEVIRVSNLQQQQLKFTYDKELESINSRIEANKLLYKDASNEDREQVAKNEEILLKTRTALTEDFNNTQQKLILEQGVKISKITDDNNAKLYELDKNYLENRQKLWEGKINLQKQILDTLISAEELPDRKFKDIQLDREKEIQILENMKNSYNKLYESRKALIQQTMTGEEAIQAEAAAFDDLTNSINETDKAIYDIETKKPISNFAQGWDPKVLGRDFKENWIQYMTDLANKTGEIMTSAIDAFITQSQRAMEMALVQMEQAANQEKDNLQTLLDEQFITRKQYEDKVKAVEKQKAEQERKLKRDQFQKEKQANIIKAVINGALAVVSAFASAGNPILGAVFAALTAALVATQISLIAKQPVPEFAQGGYITRNSKGEVGGEVVGESHSNGGVPIIAEGGEYVIRKSVVQQPGMLDRLTTINNTGYIPRFATGGLVPTVNNYNSTSMDNSMLRQIVTETVNGISSIPVTNLETEYTAVQRKVQNIETRSSW